MSHINAKWVSAEQRTLLVSFDEPWEAADLDRSVREVQQLTRDAKHDTAIIIWHRVAPNPQLFRSLNNIQKQMPPSVRRMVIVPFQWSTGVMLMTTWIGIVERLNPNKAKLSMVETINEAYKLTGETAPTAAV